jgi:simple sugar transport system ATP-binding protein
MVFQHFSLFDTLTAAENVWLGLGKSLALAEVVRRITKSPDLLAWSRPAAAGAHAFRSGERSGSRSCAR